MLSEVICMQCFVSRGNPIEERSGYRNYDGKKWWCGWERAYQWVVKDDPVPDYCSYRLEHLVETQNEKSPDVIGSGNMAVEIRKASRRVRESRLEESERDQC